MQQQEEVLQIHGHLYNLVNQVEQMQWEVARLSREAQQSNSRMTALTRHIIYAEAQKHLHERLAEFTTQLATNQEHIEHLAEPQKRIEEKFTQFFMQLQNNQELINRLTDPQKRIDEKLIEFMRRLESHEEQLEALAKTVKKLSRTQFKANALDESKEQQMYDTVALLRELVTKREELKEAQKKEEHARITTLQAQARGELAAELLPILDGIEMALEHGIPVPTDEQSGEAMAHSGFFRKLFKSSPHDQGAQSYPEVHNFTQEMQETVAGWLRGLEIVRERFLRLIEDEGIQRIPDLNEQFDPHRHVAVDTAERGDVAENTIVSVIRKGYIQNTRVLRYAEVIVAKAPKLSGAEIKKREEQEEVGKLGSWEVGTSGS